MWSGILIERVKIQASKVVGQTSDALLRVMHTLMSITLIKIRALPMPVQMRIPSLGSLNLQLDSLSDLLMIIPVEGRIKHVATSRVSILELCHVGIWAVGTHSLLGQRIIVLPTAPRVKKLLIDDVGWSKNTILLLLLFGFHLMHVFVKK